MEQKREENMRNRAEERRYKANEYNKEWKRLRRAKDAEAYALNIARKEELEKANEVLRGRIAFLERELWLLKDLARPMIGGDLSFNE